MFGMTLAALSFLNCSYNFQCDTSTSSCCNLHYSHTQLNNIAEILLDTEKCIFAVNKNTGLDFEHV